MSNSNGFLELTDFNYYMLLRQPKVDVSKVEVSSVFPPVIDFQFYCTGGHRIGNYCVECSHDGINWTNISGDKTSLVPLTWAWAGTGGFPATSARFWRLRAKGSSVYPLGGTWKTELRLLLEDGNGYTPTLAQLSEVGIIYNTGFNKSHLVNGNLDENVFETGTPNMTITIDLGA